MDSQNCMWWHLKTRNHLYFSDFKSEIFFSHSLSFILMKLSSQFKLALFCMGLHLNTEVYHNYNFCANLKQKTLIFRNIFCSVIESVVFNIFFAPIEISASWVQIWKEAFRIKIVGKILGLEKCQMFNVLICEWALRGSYIRYWRRKKINFPNFHVMKFFQLKLFETRYRTITFALRVLPSYMTCLANFLFWFSNKVTKRCARFFAKFPSKNAI